jgi:AbrB family looped-hinge helix DNA binding protein
VERCASLGAEWQARALCQDQRNAAPLEARAVVPRSAGRRQTCTLNCWVLLAPGKESLLQVKEIYLTLNLLGMARAATISSKGQITLPKEIRDRHHLHAGERVIILESREGVLLKHGKSALRGSLKGKIDSEGFERDLRKLRREWTL